MWQTYLKMRLSQLGGEMGKEGWGLRSPIPFNHTDDFASRLPFRRRLLRSLRRLLEFAFDKPFFTIINPFSFFRIRIIRVVILQRS